MTGIIISSPLDVTVNQAQTATWEDYLHRVENLHSQQERVFFH
jgi:hypothetical protein